MPDMNTKDHLNIIKLRAYLVTTWFLLILGMILSSGFIIIVILFLGDPQFWEMTYYGGIYFFPGAILSIIGFRMLKKTRRIKSYLELLEVNSLAKISSISGIPINIVIKDLKFLLLKRYILNYSLDVGEGVIIPKHEYDNQTEGEAEPLQPKVVICKKCGARGFFIPESENKCEYCGALLS